MAISRRIVAGHPLQACERSTCRFFRLWKRCKDAGMLTLPMESVPECSLMETVRRIGNPGLVTMKMVRCSWLGNSSSKVQGKRGYTLLTPRNSKVWILS